MYLVYLVHPATDISVDISTEVSADGPITDLHTTNYESRSNSLKVLGDWVDTQTLKERLSNRNCDSGLKDNKSCQNTKE